MTRLEALRTIQHEADAPQRPLVHVTHDAVVAWAIASRDFALEQAIRHADLAALCDGTVCSISEHLSDAARYLALADAIA